MKTFMLCLALNPLFAQGGTFRGNDELRRQQAIEYAETDRQEKWMWVVGVLVVGGIAAYLWNEHQKEQRKK